MARGFTIGVPLHAVVAVPSTRPADGVHRSAAHREAGSAEAVGRAAAVATHMLLVLDFLTQRPAAKLEAGPRMAPPPAHGRGPEGRPLDLEDARTRYLRPCCRPLSSEAKEGS